MTKQELASYMTSLLTLMESKEDAGIPRGKTLGEEYGRTYAAFMDIVRKEQDEARKREDGQRTEARTDLPRGERGGGSGVGDGRGSGPVVRRSGGSGAEAD